MVCCLNKCSLIKSMNINKITWKTITFNGFFFLFPWKRKRERNCHGKKLRKYLSFQFTDPLAFHPLLLEGRKKKGSLITFKVHLTPNTISAKMQTLSCSKSDLTLFRNIWNFFEQQYNLKFVINWFTTELVRGTGLFPIWRHKTDLHACSQRVNAM